MPFQVVKVRLQAKEHLVPPPLPSPHLLLAFPSFFSYHFTLCRVDTRTAISACKRLWPRRVSVLCSLALVPRAGAMYRYPLLLLLLLSFFLFFIVVSSSSVLVRVELCVLRPHVARQDFDDSGADSRWRLGADIGERHDWRTRRHCLQCPL